MKKSRVIKLSDVSKSYKIGKTKFDILKGISLEIYAGEYIIIFGPSGCGKSTLLNIISGLETVDAGKVHVRGEDITRLDANELAHYHRNKVGMVFQQFNLIKNLDVVENVALPQVFSGIGIRRRTKRAMKLLKDFELDKLAKNLPTEMSGGQQQRVAIARALVNNPWILIADEPTGNLDSKAANEVMELFKTLNEKSRRTVLMVTHNPEYVFYAHRVLYMRDGTIIKEVVNRDIRNLEEKDESLGRYENIEKDLTVSETGTKAVVDKIMSEKKLKNFNEGEFRRLIRVADDRKNGKITDSELLEILDRPFKDGGVGLYKRTAEKVALALEEKLSEITVGPEPVGPKEDTESKISPEKIARYYDKSNFVVKDPENKPEARMKDARITESGSGNSNDTGDAAATVQKPSAVDFPKEELELHVPTMPEMERSLDSARQEARIISIKDITKKQ